MTKLDHVIIAEERKIKLRINTIESMENIIELKVKCILKPNWEGHEYV